MYMWQDINICNIGSKILNNTENQRYLKNDPAVLLFLNIPSYMGGAGDVWGAAQGYWKLSSFIKIIRENWYWK